MNTRHKRHKASQVTAVTRSIQRHSCHTPLKGGDVCDGNPAFQNKGFENEL